MKRLYMVAAGLVAVGLVGTMISGCAELEAQQRAADQAQCQGYGYQPGTDQFANCMMATQQQRVAAWHEADRQANENKQREADRQALKDAAASMGQSKPQSSEAMDGFIPKSAEQGFTPKSAGSSGSNCTTTTTTTQTDNAGTSTSNTVCH